MNLTINLPMTMSPSWKLARGSHAGRIASSKRISTIWPLKLFGRRRLKTRKRPSRKLLTTYGRSVLCSSREGPALNGTERR